MKEKDFTGASEISTCDKKEASLEKLFASHRLQSDPLNRFSQY